MRLVGDEDLKTSMDGGTEKVIDSWRFYRDFMPEKVAFFFFFFSPPAVSSVPVVFICFCRFTVKLYVVCRFTVIRKLMIFFKDKLGN